MLNKPHGTKTFIVDDKNLVTRRTTRSNQSNRHNIQHTDWLVFPFSPTFEHYFSEIKKLR